ncbi:MAG: thymidine phosphorylase [Elusimicrobiota bacterium]
MQIYDIIYKKRNGGRLSGDEINFAVSGYTSATVRDYQMSALLMAMFLRGMDRKETLALTNAMIGTGDTIDLSGIRGVKVDKHSTGGVGDGTSIVLAPLVASCGVVVPMMSGRGLGHTGGTLDKLESIPGFNVNVPVEEFKRILSEIGVAMIGQTEKIAPADRKMYALRDVTATVDSIPLIAASIMSKKIAEGSDALVLDVKTGSGAFMKSLKDAELLAKTLIMIGKGAGKKVTALITDMNQPLGNAVGNALELRQCVDVLRGGGPEDFTELVLELGAGMLALAGVEKDGNKAKQTLLKNLKNGKALAKFRELVGFQGGDPAVADRPEKALAVSSDTQEIPSPKKGYVQKIDTAAVGMASVLLGAGRISKEDAVDHGAGIIIRKKIGEYAEKGEPLAEFYFGRNAKRNDAIVKFISAYTIGPKKTGKPKLLHGRMG